MAEYTRGLTRRCKPVAIKTIDLSHKPHLRNGQPVLGERDEEQSLRQLLVKALDEVDLRPVTEKGLRVGSERVGDILKRITLATKLSETKDSVILESNEVELIQQAVAAFFGQAPVITAVLRALNDAEVEAPEKKLN